MSASGVGAASGAGAFVRIAADGTVTGLPGVSYFQDGVYYDSAFNIVTPTVDLEFVKLRNSRTGLTRRITLAELATLLA